ncbi:PEP-CTERM sorting domain-containing protein [Nostoc sp. FACHB-892]|uniref:PEP-CTERM sorting domain-containing protein n=1 Tax=Nostoc sp. FACHB-892 TaxID=2692843 RepID=UPI00168541B4|nr:PEP-CTERM sorting domain-containing protein [Nostoc sp. FACHB-892]
MTKNNRKKAVAQAISTAVALGWVIMQVESAQAATLVVNNLNDSGVGSLRDTINIANSNDVVEFLLASHPSTISLTSGALAIAKNLTINGPGANLLTISGNNHFPVFDINAADVTFSGLAIAGDINAYNSSNLTFTNSTISGRNLNIDGNLTLINSTINSENLAINGGLTGSDDSNVKALDSITIGGNLTTSSGNFTISTGRLYIKGGGNNSGAAGNLTVTATDSISVNDPGSQVTIPTSTVNNNSEQINAGSNNLGAGGEITITTSTLSIRDGATLNSNSGSISNGLGGNLSLNVSDLLLLRRAPQPSPIAADSNNSGLGGNININTDFIVAVPNEPSAIAASNNNSGAGGSITLTASSVLLTRVPEPSAIAGSILAVSLAWLAKRKQAEFRKAKV